ncbi:MAG: HAMP domain-containing histidine kinase [Planctomycetes bacterium]|nr:HAMP domain-containing histidine kinase [Planctomycetota bacterium]MBU4399500.1 HAMP domain-containing histidine kinase [Planctomycetota bacterium]
MLLAIAMIALLIVLTVGWVLLSVFGAMEDTDRSGVYWALLSIGSTFILLLLVGVVLYLILSIKAINLTRRQSNFIDSVTHELKSPIASMKLYLQTLSRHQVDRQVQADFHRSMLEDLERLDHLINQMLEAGRLDAERSDDDIEDVELAGLLRDCAASVCMNYRVPADTVRLDLQPCIVLAHRMDLDIVFRNLIDNAVKYAGATPQVEVSLRPTGNGWVLARIADNGRGIPLHLQRKIFGRFVRLGLELERDKPGTGLGLYIARTLVRRMRGSIRVRDPDDGPGTVFEVQLPGKIMQMEER